MLSSTPNSLFNTPAFAWDLRTYLLLLLYVFSTTGITTFSFYRCPLLLSLPSVTIAPLCYYRSPLLLSLPSVTIATLCYYRYPLLLSLLSSSICYYIYILLVSTTITIFLQHLALLSSMYSFYIGRGMLDNKVGRLNNCSLL
ncbi:hypothetical protein J3E69DRAFT_262536 [Trichoderma sp. SZMC 28015]